MPEPLLERAIDFYRRALEENPDFPMLADFGLQGLPIVEMVGLGRCDGSLIQTLPSHGEIPDELKRLGILDGGGKERFIGCLTVPLPDSDGQPAGLAGIPEEGGSAIVLSNCTTRLWNAPAPAEYSELLVGGSLIDALAVRAVGCGNVLGVLGRRGLPKSDVAAMGSMGVRKLCFVGFVPGKALRRQLGGFHLSLKRLPERRTPHDILLGNGPARLAELIADSEPEPMAPASTPVAVPQPVVSADSLVVQRGPRRYALLGIEKRRRSLRVTIRVEYAGRLYVETLDLYSARSRKALSRDLCRLFVAPPAVMEADTSALVKAAEDWESDSARNGTQGSENPPMMENERRDAEAFGRDPNLLERIAADYERQGLVGESANKQICYLAAVSRMMDTPLSMMILSSSGAGKSALQDATLALCPPEDVVKLTTLSGRALFYKRRHSLKHKILAVEEGAGAQKATYAIRSLISAGELAIESAVRDSGTGRLTTMVNRVEGPTAIFLTTTDPDTDPETRSRFFITSVDEGREQTRRILEFQRRRQTLQGLTAGLDTASILRCHHNFQRLLRPLAVVNPYAASLRFGDDRLQGRRDQPKYLNLIKAVAFLRQMGKEVKSAPLVGSERDTEYVLVDLDDIRAANMLANEVLGGSLDDLSRPARLLLMLIEEMVRQQAETLGKEGMCGTEARSAVRFTRRDVREFTGWANSRVHRNLHELADMEYVLAESGRGGGRFRYRLAYEGQGKDGRRFMLGLSDPEELEGATA